MSEIEDSGIAVWQLDEPLEHVLFGKLNVVDSCIGERQDTLEELFGVISAPVDDAGSTLGWHPVMGGVGNGKPIIFTHAVFHCGSRIDRFLLFVAC